MPTNIRDSDTVIDRPKCSVCGKRMMLARRVPTPALGAGVYQVQWSKTRYPFVAEVDPRTNTKGFLTFSTSSVLPLAWMAARHLRMERERACSIGRTESARGTCGAVRQHRNRRHARRRHHARAGTGADASRDANRCRCRQGRAASSRAASQSHRVVHAAAGAWWDRQPKPGGD